MYYCNRCEEFVTCTEDEKCSRCGTEDIEKAGECGCCGEPIKSNEDYCEECMKVASRYIFELASELEITTADAKDLLLACMEKES